MFSSVRSALWSVWSIFSYRPSGEAICPAPQRPSGQPPIQPVPPSVSASVAAAATNTIQPYRRVANKKPDPVVTTSPSLTFNPPPPQAKKRPHDEGDTSSSSKLLELEKQSTAFQSDTSTKVELPVCSTPSPQQEPPSTLIIPEELTGDHTVDLTQSPDTTPLEEYITPDCVASNITQAFTDRVTPDKNQLALQSLFIPTGKTGMHIIKKENLDTLDEGEWIDDKIVNTSFEILTTQLEQSNSSIRIKTMSSMLLNMVGMDYFKIPIHTRPLGSLRNYDRIIFPVHRKNHWLLVVLDVNKKSIFSLDSLNTSMQAREITTIKEWLQDYYKDGKDSSSMQLASELEIGIKVIPKQNNSNDCGPAMIKMGACFYQPQGDIPKKLKPSDYTTFRKTIRKTLQGCSLIDKSSLSLTREREDKNNPVIV